MIIGIGIDLVELSRVQQIIGSPEGERFLQRVLTETERKLAGERKGRLAEFVAGRFAAKEAVVKALGCGIGAKVGFHDIEVLPEPEGRPAAALSSSSAERAGLPADARIHLSITHTKTTAAAYAVIERELPCSNGEASSRRPQG